MEDPSKDGKFSKPLPPEIIQGPDGEAMRKIMKDLREVCREQLQACSFSIERKPRTR